MIKDSYGNTRFFGVYRGVVFDTKDPLNKHRLRLKVPQILADLPTEWAWPVHSAGTAMQLPEVNAGVWVQFEGGDPSFPIWTGTFDELINTTQATPQVKTDGITVYKAATNTLSIDQDAFSHISTLDYAQLNTVYQNGSTDVGRIAWSTHDSTPEVKVTDSVTLQIGQEFHARVHNGEETPLIDGQVVHFSGEQGEDGHPSVLRYVADGAVSAFRVVGIVTETILPGGEGMVTTKGIIRDLDTSEYSLGDVLYASPLFAGGITNAQPTPPDETVVVAVVTKTGVTDGEIYVTVTPVINQLDTNLTLYPTNVLSTDSGLTSYYKMVNSLTDPDFNSTAVTIPVSAATLSGGAGTTDILVGSLVAPANLFTGDPGASINVSTIGNVMRTAGNSQTQTLFFFKVFKRTAAGVETLVGVSNETGPSSGVTNNVWQQFSASASTSLGSFTNTDRIVIKYYAHIVAATGAQAYAFQFGGDQPVRSVFPVPVAVISTAPAGAVSVSTTNFNGVLTSTEDTVQKSLDKLDDHNHALASLTGVSISSPTLYNHLKYNGTSWVNSSTLNATSASITGTLTGVDANFSGDVVVSNTSPSVAIKDSNGSGTSHGARLTLQDSAGDLTGLIGFNNTSLGIFSLRNYIDGGDIRIYNADGADAFLSLQATKLGVVVPSGYLNVSGTYIRCLDTYGRDITGTRRAMWVQSDGLYGYASSTIRAKQDVTSSTLDVSAVLSIEPKNFRYKAQVESRGEEAAVEVGFIAEDLDAAGLSQFVYYDEEGRPEGVSYETFSVALLQVARNQQAQLDALIARIEALESR